MNYIGGKQRLLSQILPLLPHNIDTFVDLFCGGCSVGLNAPAQRVILNDNLTYLIDLYRAFARHSTPDILSYIDSRIAQFDLSRVNESGYKLLRESYNTAGEPLDLFVLIAYSFNHQIRFNNSHQFNNPFGRERSSFNPRMRENLIAFLGQLHNREVEFVNSNFDQVDLAGLTPNDFVYCDPPYLITRGTYNDGKRGFTGWDNRQELTLLSLLDSLTARNVKFALSNVVEHKGKINTLLTEWIAQRGYHANRININYANSSYQTSDKVGSGTVEVLVTNYKPPYQENLLF